MTSHINVLLLIFISTVSSLQDHQKQFVVSFCVLLCSVELNPDHDGTMNDLHSNSFSQLTSINFSVIDSLYE